MRIPKSFRLMGCEYTVTVVQPEDWKDNESCGLFYSYTREIHVLFGPPESVEHAFLHELMHAVMHAMGETKLYGNEKFIDMSAGLLHQALISAVYE